MTRKSKREIERALEDMAPETRGRDVVVAWRRNPGVSGELVDADGEPIDYVDPGAFVVVINRWEVMPRDEAIENDREILGPAPNTTPRADAVRVARPDP